MPEFDLTLHAPPELEINPLANRFAVTNGIQLCYLDEGQGEPILFIHGGGACIETWNNQLSHFAATNRVIAPDNRGHGRSGDAEAPYSHKLYISDMIGLLDSLDIEKAHIVGWSDGSCFALGMALFHPERVASLCMLGGMYSMKHYPPEVINGLRTMSASDYYPYLVSLYRRLSDRDWDKFFEKCRPMWLSEPNYQLNDMANIGAVTTIIIGSDDEWGGQTQARELQQMIPNCNLLIVEGADHSAHMTHATVVNGLIAAHILELKIPNHKA